MRGVRGAINQDGCLFNLFPNRISCVERPLESAVLGRGAVLRRSCTWYPLKVHSFSMMEVEIWLESKNIRLRGVTTLSELNSWRHYLVYPYPETLSLGPVNIQIGQDYLDQFCGRYELDLWTFQLKPLCHPSSAMFPLSTQYLRVSQPETKGRC